MSEFIIEKVEEFAKSLLPSLGLELVEVQFRREGHGWVLRIFIDTDEGVTVDHCASVSREVSDYLDVEDFINHPFHLEVSSPGLERSLRTVGDFIRFTGKKARVKLREEVEGQKVFIGIIEHADDEALSIVLEDNGSTVRLPFELIRKARLSL